MTSSTQLRNSVHARLRTSERVRLWGAGYPGLSTQMSRIEWSVAEATKKGNER